MLYKLDIKDFILSEEEETLFKLIARTGFFVDPYKTDMTISQYTINKNVRKGLIEKNSPTLIFTKLCTTYSLTQKGTNLVKNKFLINPYRSRERQVEHDFILGKVYLNLSEEEKNTWKTETELQLKYPKISVVDGIYLDRYNNRVGVEVITESYPKRIINSKKAFIEKYCDREIIINTKEVR